ncbi:quinone oxidoreductase [Malassezia pachydermatis]|uniref:Quinone oxidoreductase n=1 Tax=Malassezia pachydermatis TaxID=77020 RepID=A0A0M8MS26_9BASI|nr:quinone oxidoreductase [Malassezia pachydermatis]KOS13194.1 quinone oxidoreductase [Malassezia pachydermatis]
MLPTSMRAVIVDQGKGPSSALRLGEVPTPVLQVENEPPSIIVKVRAFGLNRMDLYQREGKYPVPPGISEILGVEFSGEVAGVGQGVSGFQPGDSVLGLAQGGAYAEYIKVPASMTLQKSPKLSWEQAAAIPEAFLTAYQALELLTSQKPGDNVLIHAGASGVGLAAIQLARLRGARTIYVTAGSQEKIDVCKSLGATEGFNYKESDWAAELHKATNGQGVDVILDFVGASYFANNLKSLRRDGRMSVQAFLGGSTLPQGTNLAPLLAKRLRIEGSTLRSRSVEYQTKLVQGFLQSGGLEALERGADGTKNDKALQLIIHKAFDWHDIKQAHDEMEANKNIGKMVVTIS